MKAVVLTRYGSPKFLQVNEVAKPQIKDNEVLIKVKASTVTRADTMMRQANPFISRLILGFFKPRKNIVGTGFAGVVVEAGNSVTQFKEGDEVFGESGVNFGANAEYVSVAADGVIALKPTDLSFEEAATISDGALTSLNFLKNIANLQPGQKILINGASGSLGVAAVQLAKYYGAEVTGVCGPTNVELVKSLGADHVINYRETDFTKNGEKYDIIYDTVRKTTHAKSKGSLTEKGIYMSPVLKLKLLWNMILTSKSKTKKAKFTATGLQPAEGLRELLSELKTIIKAGKYKVIIDRRYKLEQAPEAHQYVDLGRKKGNVVIVV